LQEGGGQLPLYGYNAEEYNPTTQLTYLRARYVDPETGRFNTKDSMLGNVATPITLNTYLYAKSNPVMYIDPSGHVALLNGLESVAKGAVSGAQKVYNTVVKPTIPTVANALKNIVTPVTPWLSPAAVAPAQQLGNSAVAQAMKTANTLISGVRALNSAAGAGAGANPFLTFIGPLAGKAIASHLKFYCGAASALEKVNAAVEGGRALARTVVGAAIESYRFVGEAGKTIRNDIFSYLLSIAPSLLLTGKIPLFDVMKTFTNVYNMTEDKVNKGELDNFLRLTLGVERNTDGTLRIVDDYWQPIFGYSDPIDWGLIEGMGLVGKITGTNESADARKFEFVTADGKRHIMWMWQGDYLALGGGGEIGHYRDPVQIGDLELWQSATGKDEKLRISMKVEFPDGKSYALTNEQVFWLTVFSPAHQGLGPGDIKITYTLDFTGRDELWNGFYKEHGIPGNDRYGSKWIFDKDAQTATYVW